MTNLTIILACLSMIESGDNDLAVGDRGRSRGRYQISERVWTAANPPDCYPWERCAHSPTIAKAVAEWTLNRRIGRFKRKRDKDPSPFELYVLWNAPAQIGHPSKVVSEKAKRFENLVRKMEKEKK